MTLNAPLPFVAATGSNERKNPNHPHFSPPHLGGGTVQPPAASQPPQGSPIAGSPGWPKVRTYPIPSCGN
jgi:hypothetical protein